MISYYHYQHSSHKKCFIWLKVLLLSNLIVDPFLSCPNLQHGKRTRDLFWRTLEHFYCIFLEKLLTNFLFAFLSRFFYYRIDVFLSIICDCHVLALLGCFVHPDY